MSSTVGENESIYIYGDSTETCEFCHKELPLEYMRMYGEDKDEGGFQGFICCMFCDPKHTVRCHHINICEECGIKSECDNFCLSYFYNNEEMSTYNAHVKKLCVVCDKAVRTSLYYGFEPIECDMWDD